MFFDNRPVQAVSPYLPSLVPSLGTSLPGSPNGQPQASRRDIDYSFDTRAHVAKALGMKGMEALLYLAQPADHPRPMIKALLDKLQIQGIAT